MRELENCLIRFKMFKNTDWTGWTDDGFIINTYHDPYRARLSSLRLSINPNTPIVKRENIPTPAKKACLYIFSFASASLSCRYYTRYCVICAILRNVDALSFIRFIVSLFIFFKIRIIYHPTHLIILAGFILFKLI